MLTQPDRFARSSATSSMPTITDLHRPRRPARSAARSTRRSPAAADRRRPGRRRLRASAPAVRRDDAHEGGVSGRQRRWRASDAPCCGSTSAASAAAKARSTRAKARRTDFSAALDYMAGALSGRRRSGPPASRSAPGSRSKSARSTIAVSALIGIAPPVATSVSGMNYTFRHAREHEAEVLRSGRSRRGLPDRRHVEVLRPAARAEGARRHRRRRSSVRRQDAGSRRGARRFTGRFFRVDPSRPSWDRRGQKRGR